MNEQTAKFDNLLRNMSFHLENENIDEILRVCKEAGLKFVKENSIVGSGYPVCERETAIGEIEL